MNDLYSPHTGEHIVTDTPADWMLRADVDAPDYDRQTSGCFWRVGAWVVIVSIPYTEPITPYTVLREAAYKLEADPLFFQEQRGEVPAGTWADKVAEIKLRYPKPVI